MYNSRTIVVETVMRLGDAEKRKFISMYLKSKKNTKRYKDEYPFEETYSDYQQVLEASENFLTAIPEYVELKETLNVYRKKMLVSVEEFKSTIDLIVELMEKGVK
ncbi:MAG: hypothetical protein ACP5HX_10955, partial [Thermoproteota archaeon]